MPQKSILVIDDDLTIRIVLKGIINYFFPSTQATDKPTIFTSGNGVEGLGYVFINLPDLLFLDLTLPKYDGLEIIDYITSNKQLTEKKKMPIIVLEDGVPMPMPVGSNAIASLSKGDKNFGEHLVRGISQILHINTTKNRPNNFLSKLVKKVGSRTINLANTSDELFYKSDTAPNVPISLWYRFLFTMAQLFLGLSLSFFYFLTSSKQQEENIVQQKKDAENLRVKTVPAIAVFLAGLLVVVSQLCIFSFTGLSTLRLSLFPAQAASLTWDGGGATNDWSECTNWTSDTCPTSGDSVTFDGTSTKNATVDGSFTGTITNLTISSGYTGTITMARSLSITSAFSQGAGTFTAASQTLDIDGDFTLSTGIFTASSGTTFVGANFTISGGTFNHNSGTFTFDTNATGTLSCNSATFNLVTFNGANSQKNVLSGCTLPLGNNPTLPSNQLTVIFGTLSGTGTLNGGQILTLSAGGALSGFTGLTGSELRVAGPTIDFNSYSSVTFTNIRLFSGTLTMTTAGYDLDGTLAISGGTFTAPSGNMTIGGDLTISGSPTFNANGGTITFDGTTTATLSCNSTTFNLVAFNHTAGTKTVSSDCNLPLGANGALGDPLSSTAAVINSGTLSGSPGSPGLAGNLTLNAGSSIPGFDAFTGRTLTIAGATVDFSSFWQFNVSTGGSGLTITSGTITLPTSGAGILGQTTISGGTFNAASGSMTLAGGLTISGSPTFNANGGTIVFGDVFGQSGNSSITCNNVTFNSVSISNTAGSKTINSSCNLPLGNNPTISSRPVTLNGGTLTGTGTLTQGGSSLTFNSGGALSGFSGVALNDLTVAGGTPSFSGYSTVDINGNLVVSSGSLTAPAGNMTVAKDFTVSGGTFNANGGNVTFDGTNQHIVGTTFQDFTKIVSSADTLTFPAGGTETILGTLTLKGAAGQRLSLVSSSPGTQWNIDPQGTRDINHVNVQDSNNINATAIDLTMKAATNNGNNINWLFENITTPGTPSTTNPTNDNTPTWTWTASTADSGIDHYVVNWCDNAGFSGCGGNIASPATNSYTHTVSVSEGPLYLQVKAVSVATNESGYSGSGQTFIDTINPTNPGTPSPAASPTTDTTPTWTWTASTDGGSGLATPPYTVEWCQDAGFSVGCSTNTAASNTYTHSVPLSEDTWYFRVKAKDLVNNESGYSSGTVVIDTTNPTTPGAPLAASPTTDTTPTWIWNASSDSGAGLATPAYTVEWCQDSGFSVGCSSNTAASNTYTHLVPLSEGLWYFHVKAKDTVNNESGYSSAGQIFIDLSAPTGSIIIDGGNNETNTENVILSISATDNASVSSNIEMRISEDSNMSGAIYESYVNAKAFTLSSGDGTKTVYIQFRDELGNESSNYSDSIVLNTNVSSPVGDTNPPTGTITINGGQNYTNDTNVLLSISANDDVSLSSGIQMKVSEDSALTGASYEPYVSAKPFTVSSGDGVKTIYIRFKDEAGNESNIYSDSIVLNTGSMPAGLGFSGSAWLGSENAPYFTNTSATFNNLYQVSGTSSYTWPGGVFDQWPAFDWGYGFNTNFVGYTNYVFSISGNDPGSQWCADGHPTLLLSGAGWPGVLYVNSTDGTYNATFPWQVAVTGVGVKGLGCNVPQYSENWDFTLRLVSVDGNVVPTPTPTPSPTPSSTPTLTPSPTPSSTTPAPTPTPDTTSPTGSITINGGNANTNSQFVLLSINGNDDVSSSSGLQMKLSEDSNLSGAVYEPYVSAKAFILSAGDGMKTVYIRFKDEAGNESIIYTDTILLDTIPPTTPGTPQTGAISIDPRPIWTWTGSSDGGSGLAANPYTVQWCKDDESFTDATCNGNIDTSGIISYTNGTALSDGTWYFRVKAVDAAGNESPYSNYGTVLIQSVTPTPTITPSGTPTPTPSETPSGSETPTPTVSVSPSGTDTPSGTPSVNGGTQNTPAPTEPPPTSGTTIIPTVAPTGNIGIPDSGFIARTVATFSEPLVTISTQPQVAAIISTLLLETLVAAGITSSGALIQTNIWYGFLLLFDKLKKRLQWGVAYNSVTKKPLSRVILRVYKGKILVETTVTDGNGVYQLSLKPGTYTIQPVKTGFAFPSKVVAGNTDGRYTNIYKGEKITISEGTSLITRSVPLDGKEDTSIASALLSRVSVMLELLNLGIVLLGFSYSIIKLFVEPSLLNTAFVGIYVAFFAVKFLLWKAGELGTLRDDRGHPLAGVELGLYETEFNTLVSRIFTDENGKYIFFVDNKAYTIKIIDQRYTLSRKVIIPRVEKDTLRRVSMPLVAKKV